MSNTAKREVVITGIGLVSPIGIGKERFWQSLVEGHSGVRRNELFAECGHVSPLGADVADFDPKQYVRPRKALKVMSRDIQIGFAAADLACVDGQLPQHPVDPERIGIVLGADMIACELDELAEPFKLCIENQQFKYERWGQAMASFYPLWMLKYLPNMPACHIGITQDFRGPNNSLVMAEVSSLAAFIEAVRVIERGQADAMIAGGVGSRIHPTIWTHDQLWQLSGRANDPAAACRPFDAQRDGTVHGEGSGTFLLETRQSAEARGVPILATVRGFATASEPISRQGAITGAAVRRAIAGALAQAGVAPAEIGHVNAHGMGTTDDDQIEAQAIRAELGDVPVTAIKSYFGYLGAGSGAVEMAASVLAFQHKQVPRTLNYETPDPACPINVVHGQALATDNPLGVVLSHARTGQAVAVVLSAA